MSLARQFASVAGGTLGSRIFGFVRETLMAAALGAGPAADAFYAAFRFPNLFRRLFAEGAFNAAFVPLFAGALEGEGPAAAQKLADEVLAVLVLVLGGLTALVLLATPFIVALIAPGFVRDASKFDLTVELFRVMFPYLICMSLTAMASGMLNAHRRFVAAAVAPILLNIALIGALAIGIWTGADGATVARLLSWAVLIGGAAQLIMVAVAAQLIGVRWRLIRPRLTPGVRRMLWLAAPVAVSGGITQINLFIGQIIASGKPGAIAILQYADRLYQLPLGVVGVAIGVVLLPELSRSLKSGHLREAENHQNRALEFALFLTVPAAIGLAIASEEIVRVLYERGAFSPGSTLSTARALAVYGLGLPAFVMIRVFAPGYFAREDTRTPMIFAAVSVAANIAFAITLFPHMAEAGIAAAETIAGWINTGLLFTMLARRKLFDLDARTRHRAPRLLFSAAVMGVALFGGKILLARAFVPGAPLLTQVGALALLVGGSALLYLALAQLTGAADMRALAANLRRRPPVT